MVHVLRSKIEESTLQDAPIPAEWVVAGAPRARSVLLARSLDGTMTTSHWDCTAGSFNWRFGCEETVHILEGEVFVRAETGETFTLKPGDVAVFHADTTAHWSIPTYVRKLAINRQPMPVAVGFGLRAWRKAAQHAHARLTMAAAAVLAALSATPVLELVAFD